MKTLSFITVLLLFVNVFTYAQKSKVTTAESLLLQRKFEKAKEVIDEAIKHENCINYAKAHSVRGKIYQGIFEQDSVLREQFPDLLEVAWEEYQAAIKLDEKNRLEKELKLQFQFLANDFINHGVNSYNADKFEKALEYFKRSLEVHASPYGSQKIDTLTIHYAGIVANKLERWDEAIGYFKRLIALDYDEVNSNAIIASILLHQSRSALATGGTLFAKAKQEEGFQYLMDGHKKNPTDEFMLVELINYYLLGDHPEKAEPYLDEAIRQYPRKAEFYRVKGSLYEKLQQVDKAEAMYIKTLEVDPTDFIAQYSLASIKLDKISEENKKLNDIEDNKLYNAAVDKIMQKYEEVLPYFERALELEPTNENTLTMLSRIYFILRTRPNTGPAYQKKYEQMQERLKQ
jgi:tetratricopeptide (TPR) repeat protein